MAHIHVEKLLDSTLLPMAYPVDGANPLQGNNVPIDALGDDSQTWVGVSLSQSMMLEKGASRTYEEAFEASNGTIQLAGTVWSASAHIITAVIGSGVPSLAWAIAQLGWIAGPATMILFSVVCMLPNSIMVAAFGDESPGNLLTGFGFYNPYWLLDIANVAIVVHLLGSYQGCCQPLFKFIENNAARKFPESDFMTKEFEVPIPGCKPLKLNLFRLVWRTSFVICCTVIAMVLPFFNDIVGLIGAIAYWPLTVYFPVEMYIVQTKLPKWSRKWICLHMLSAACFVLTMVATVGSIAGVVDDLKVYESFMTNY
ncbi:amino acid permease 2-like [Vigna unguiculata]|uniref:amino acid permease 2-like n=1 Tax=Vigna unguiculata TaxID=3917 RepID=UPI001016C0AF|nr:amino acid permease 2-like [Vigna unguiculata]